MIDPGGIEARWRCDDGRAVARAVRAGRGRGAGRRRSAALASIAARRSTGPYCHQCGQPAHVHRSLAAFWHDLAHGVLHFDGKIWRTLPLLAWRPGELTRRYIEGERARFVSPMALFLFSVFLMFAVFTLRRRPGLRPTRKRTGGLQIAARARTPSSSCSSRSRRTRSRARPADRARSTLSIAAELQGAAAVVGDGERGVPPEHQPLDLRRVLAGSTAAYRERQGESAAARSTSCRPTPTNSPGR